MISPRAGRLCRNRCNCALLSENSAVSAAEKNAEKPTRMTRTTHLERIGSGMGKLKRQSAWDVNAAAYDDNALAGHTRPRRSPMGNRKPRQASLHRLEHFLRLAAADGARTEETF